MKSKDKKRSPLKSPLMIAIFAVSALIGLVIILLPVLLAGYIFIARPYQISGAAMAPNFNNGEYRFVKNMRPSVDLQRGDVVIYTNKTTKAYMKRIIGLPGEEIVLIGGVVHINNYKLGESAYLSSSVKTDAGQFLKEGEAKQIPEDMFVMMGDNRPFSNDSRNTGFVPRKDIVGKVWFCYLNCLSIR